MKLGVALVTTLAVLLPGGAEAADYVRIHHEIVIGRSADTVWKRVGHYCDIAEWMQVKCELKSGAGDVGSVRDLRGGAVVEVMVAKTAHSYTYWQTAGNLAVAGYHGTLAVEPDGQQRSRLAYTLFYNQAALPTEAVRRSERARISARFLGLLGVMRTLVLAK